MFHIKVDIHVHLANLHFKTEHDTVIARNGLKLYSITLRHNNRLHVYTHTLIIKLLLLYSATSCYNIF